MDIESPDIRDRSDMERLAAGDPKALDDLMGRHAPAVFNFLCRMLGDESEAEDLAQETFVRVYQSCRSFQLERRFTTWLFTIAANLARTRLRSRSRHPQISLEARHDEESPSLSEALPAELANPAQQAVNAERIEAIRAAVNQLPEDLREVIILCEWQELSMAEAAATLKTTGKAVESRLYRARQQLREKLTKWLNK
jgi:RNA polymerase sigma-70 factor (ECF subfamily)